MDKKSKALVGWVICAWSALTTKCLTTKMAEKGAESESEVAQSCLTLCDPMDCSLPGSTVHGIFQARIS